MKTCNRCQQSKELDQFAKDKSKKDGYRTICRQCSSAQKREAYKNKDFTLVPTVEFKCCSTCNNTKKADEFDNDKRKADGLAWECKICRATRYKEQYPQHAEKRRKKSSLYYKNNIKKALACNLRYQNKREKEDILYRLTRRLRNRLYYALKRAHWKTNVSFNDYVGCSLDELKSHLQAKFTEGMTWKNWGMGEKCWVIDHIYPLSLAKTEEEMLKLCHYTNLQPMWFIPNIIKSNKIGE